MRNNIENFADNSTSVEDIVCNATAKDVLLKVMKTIPEQEQKVLMLRFFTYDDRVLGFKEIGKELGISAGRAGQICKKALSRLRHHSRRKYYEDYILYPRSRPHGHFHKIDYM